MTNAKRALSAALVLLCLGSVTACGSTPQSVAPPVPDAPRPGVTTAPTPAPTASQTKRVQATMRTQSTAPRPGIPAQARLEALAAAVLQRAQGPVSLAARDAQGRVVLIESSTPSIEASIVKVEILLTLLRQRHADGAQLDEEETDLARAMITESDNDATDELWDRVGRAEGLDQTHALLGLTTTVSGSDQWWGLGTTGASDQLRLLHALHAPDSPVAAEDRDYVVALMNEVVEEQRWGVSVVGAGPLKNGWLDPDEATGDPWVVNSIGIVTPEGAGPLEIVVLTSGWESIDDGIAAVEELAKAAAEALRAS